MNSFLEFKDFSGGITDKVIPGSPNRYATAENLFIDTDQKLYTRDGFNIYSSTAYQVTTSERISRLVNFDESELIALHNKKVDYISAGAWTALTGPGGNNAFNTNSASSITQEAQWNHHLYLASDSGDPVIKLYRDSVSALKLRSAGLPEMTTATTPTDLGLADAITLCNDLITKMKAHYLSDDATAAGNPDASSTAHHAPHADLAAQYAAVNALSNATNLTTLVSNLNTLRTHYTTHINDAKKQPFGSWAASGKSYHIAPSTSNSLTNYKLYTTTDAQAEYTWRNILNIPLINPDYTIQSTETITNVLVYLNDLRDKWNWHQYAPLTHYNGFRYTGTVQYGGIGASGHITSIARVQPYTWAKIGSNVQYFADYVKNIRLEFEKHIANASNHIAADTVNDIPSAWPENPTTFQDAVALLGALAFFFDLHWRDAETTYYQYTADATSGSATLTNVSPNPTTQVSGAGYKCVPLTSTTGSPYDWTNNPTLFSTRDNPATNSTATTIVCTSNFGASVTTDQFIFTRSRFHTGLHSSAPFDSLDFAKSLEELNPALGTVAELQAYIDLAEDLSSAISAHSLNRTSASTLTDSIVRNGTYMDLKTILDFSDTVGANISPHQGVDGLWTFFFPEYIDTDKDFIQNFFTDTKPTAASYLFKSIFKYTYTVGTSTFVDLGAESDPIQVIGVVPQESSAGSGQALNPFAFTNIYSHTNASNQNWDTGDTTNFLKEIYRTAANGSVYFKTTVNGLVGAVSNATTTYSDIALDEDLISNELLYTSGGVVSNNKPPLAKYIHVHEGRMYYGLGNKVYQSLLNDPDSVPEDFYEELNENVTGISSTKNHVVVSTAIAIYRLDGEINDLGQGALRFEKIFNQTGSECVQGLVKADDGCFFVGRDAVYFTDGVSCVPVTDTNTAFLTYTATSAKRDAIQGVYDRLNKRILWTIGASPAETILVLDLQFGIKKYLTPYTLLTGGWDSYSGFRPTAVAFYGDTLVYGDNLGYVYKLDSALAHDLTRDSGTAATSWAARPVMWKYKSCHSDYGRAFERKYYTKTFFHFDQETNISVQPVSDVDNGRITSNLPIIRSRKLTNWNDSKIDWITTSKAGNIIEEMRRYAGDGSLRSTYRALELKNAYCVIISSASVDDPCGNVNITNISANVWALTLINSSTRKWPLYSVGYKVKIAGVEYPVTVRTSDSVIRVDDTGLTALSVQSNVAWEMWGYPKDEYVKLLEYAVQFSFHGDQEKDYAGTTSLDGGENG